VPVGRATRGRIINVIGEAIDEKGDLSKIYANLNHLISIVYYYDVKIFNDYVLIPIRDRALLAYS
jgi:F0F1-type ATP synthase beta subunit